MLRGQCCPICGQTFMGSSLKYHLKVCARTTIAQTTGCEHCGRTIRKEDLPEHAPKCKKKLEAQQRQGLGESSRRAHQERSRLLVATLSKIEAGETFQMDSNGLFVCSLCGQQGLGLLEILPHEDRCRNTSSICGPGSGELSGAAVPEPRSLLATTLRDAVADLRAEVQASVANADEILPLVLERLRDVVQNACQKDEKKYRKLRCSNPSFAEAIGRWTAGVRILEAVGFQVVELQGSRSNGTPEPHLVLQERLSDETYCIAAQALDGRQDSFPKSTSADQGALRLDAAVSELPSTACSSDTAVAASEQCPYCLRFFRFDRIAKHETRCTAGKDKNPQKFDHVRNSLEGTIGECHISEIKRHPRPMELPLLKNRPQISSTGYPDSVPNTNRTSFFSLTECDRCGRSFAPEAFERHTRSCKGGASRPRSRGSGTGVRERGNSSAGSIPSVSDSGKDASLRSQGNAVQHGDAKSSSRPRSGGSSRGGIGRPRSGGASSRSSVPRQARGADPQRTPHVSKSLMDPQPVIEQATQPGAAALGAPLVSHSSMDLQQSPIQQVTQVSDVASVASHQPVAPVLHSVGNMPFELPSEDHWAQGGKPTEVDTLVPQHLLPLEPESVNGGQYSHPSAGNTFEVASSEVYGNIQPNHSDFNTGLQPHLPPGPETALMASVDDLRPHVVLDSSGVAASLPEFSEPVVGWPHNEYYQAGMIAQVPDAEHLLLGPMPSGPALPDPADPLWPAPQGPADSVIGPELPGSGMGWPSPPMLSQPGLIAAHAAAQPPGPMPPHHGPGYEDLEVDVADWFGED